MKSYTEEHREHEEGDDNHWQENVLLLRKNKRDWKITPYNMKQRHEMRKNK